MMKNEKNIVEYITGKNEPLTDQSAKEVVEGIENLPKENTDSWIKVDQLIEQYRVNYMRKQGNFSDMSNPENFAMHWSLLLGMANTMLINEHRKFEVDENNAEVIIFLLYYFNNSPLATSVFNMPLHKPVFLTGEIGTGKTFLMELFSAYLKKIGNPNRFNNMSVAQLINYQKKNGHIDQFTYNEENSEGYKPQPYSLCINDLGVGFEGQKTYGTEIKDVIDEFLFARYEIGQFYHKKTHITTNLTMPNMVSKLSDHRFTDRFKEYNVITLKGKSRRI